MHGTLEKGGLFAHVSLPSFLQADDIATAGHLNLWRLHGVLTKSKIIVCYVPCDPTGGTFLDYDKMMAGRFSFMASVKTRLYKDYYRIRDIPTTPSLRVTHNLSYVGNSSLSTTLTLNCSDSGKVFANSTYQAVVIDAATRLPAPLPDWWKKKFEWAIIGNKPLFIERIVSRAGSFTYDAKIPWTDLDLFKHINYTAYIRYCYDCAFDAIVNGAYPTFKDRNRLNRVSGIDMSFSRECFPNDILNIATWEDPNDPSTLRFDMTVRGQDAF
ncbi:hypothetical protein NP493_12g07057 [Ridgeia piscesae]|uniref:Acyl-ACP thioesterase n=1 Tax=Ridgeia piscesae TaxID=27915 RepID=A0AAD9PEQ3_RIDPI|nr:hypothetical protein NP493_12g07057 [Ridgeia piscesae]